MVERHHVATHVHDTWHRLCVMRVHLCARVRACVRTCSRVRVICGLSIC